MVYWVYRCWRGDGVLFGESNRKTEFCCPFYNHLGDALFLCHELETKGSLLNFIKVTCCFRLAWSLSGFFCLYPVTLENIPVMGLLFGILLDYALFAFIINFIREIVKDLQDVNGDLNQGA